jgi:hypothetical protein
LRGNLLDDGDDVAHLIGGPGHRIDSRTRSIGTHHRFTA